MTSPKKCPAITASRPKWNSGEASGRPVPVAVDTFNALRDRQTSDEVGSGTSLRGRVNLLNWDGRGAPPGLFPDKGPEPDTLAAAEDQP